MSVASEIESKFAVAAQGYEPAAVHAYIEELELARENLRVRAEQAQRETEDLTRALAARDAESAFELLLDNLRETLGAAYGERLGMQQDGRSWSGQERAQAQKMVVSRLAQLDEESARATARAEAAARQLLDEAARAAGEIRAAGVQAAAKVAAGAGEVLEAARVKVEQRSAEIIADLTARQRASEEAQTVAQARADARLEQAVRAAGADTTQARSMMESAEQTAARIIAEARQQAAELVSETARAADHLRRESERAAVEVAANLRSISRFVDGLPLPAGLLDPAPQQPNRPPADPPAGLLADVTSLRAWRRIR